QAAAMTALLIVRFGAKAVINTGSAGAIAPGLAIGDTVISERVAYHDVDLCVFGYRPGQMAGHEPFFAADNALRQAACQVAATMDCLGKVKGGTVLSGDQFVSSPGRKAQLRSMFEDAAVTEMEGAAIAQICTDFKVPFLVVRAVSDAAEEGQGMTFDEFLPIASRHSATLVRALLRELGD
ncbi:MAG: 5'-methylthioadenosine/adenosylhomocysteine nucleosidase, partial [Succinivibrionaceae bacterium]|nr:5'-methylthioadenosine/adenosylhomocysteine nucleosidase [Succinivibrionaceae bacterium]